MFSEPVEQGDYLFGSLATGHGLSVCDFEEGRSDFGQPFRLDGGHFTAVLLRGQHELVVDDPVASRSGSRAETAKQKDEPFRSTVEQGRAGMDENRGAFDERLVPFLRILLGSVPEVA